MLLILEILGIWLLAAVVLAVALGRFLRGDADYGPDVEEGRE
jgi:hypothetical protein